MKNGASSDRPPPFAGGEEWGTHLKNARVPHPCEARVGDGCRTRALGMASWTRTQRGWGTDPRRAACLGLCDLANSWINPAAASWAHARPRAVNSTSPYPTATGRFRPHIRLLMTRFVVQLAAAGAAKRLIAVRNSNSIRVPKRPIGFCNSTLGASERDSMVAILHKAAAKLGLKRRRPTPVG